MTYALNNPGDWECRHGIDLRYSRCGSCMEKPRGNTGKERYAPSEATDASGWQSLAAIAFEDDGTGLGAWTEAKWSGTCRLCGHQWEPGEAIRKDDDEDAWICEACGVK